MVLLSRAGHRPAWVLVHRCVGLLMAGFLVLAGLTGALLTWYQELDTALNARMMKAAAPFAGAVPLDPLLLRERVLSAFPGREVHRVPLRFVEGRAADFWVAPTGNDAGERRQVFLDPYTGRILGSRRWGDLSEGRANLMPFVYRLHHDLTVGPVGAWVLGVIALLWALDCFVGIRLCLPARSRAADARSNFARWRAMWTVRWKGSRFRRFFDLHRAGALWLWLMLFIFAWSSVSLNLPGIYEPVMRLFFDHQPSPSAMRPADTPTPRPPALHWESARVTGDRLMREAGRQHGFVVLAPDRLIFEAGAHRFRYVAQTDRDVSDRWGSTAVYFDASTGTPLGVFIPSGKAAGDTLTTWLGALHLASVGGTPYRIAVTLIGLALVILSATGVYVWWRKRLGRTVTRSRASGSARGSGSGSGSGWRSVGGNG